MSCLLNHSDFAKFPHNAINDAESFLWVMGYLIIRLKGPGKDNEMTRELRDALKVFSGDAESQLQKLDILNDKEVFREFLTHVSPEFAVLEELMYAWHRVIDLARRFPSGMEFNYPHRAVSRMPWPRSRLGAGQQEVEDRLVEVRMKSGWLSASNRLFILCSSIRAIKGKDQREAFRGWILIAKYHTVNFLYTSTECNVFC